MFLMNMDCGTYSKIVFFISTLTLTSAQLGEESGCMKLHNAYEAICPGQFQREASLYSAGPPGKRGAQGEKGDRGERGLVGEIGPTGQVDYARVNEMIQEVRSALERELQKSLENIQRLEEKADRPIFEECYMGMKSGTIPNSAITASSSAGSNRHEHYRARLDNQITSTGVGAWAAGRNVVGEYLQIDIGETKTVKGVITQGRPSEYSQWVATFKVSCGTTLNDFRMIEYNGSEKVFVGNTDMESKVYNEFPQVLSCRYIRIYPQTYRNHMSMRVELVSGNCRGIGF